MSFADFICIITWVVVDLYSNYLAAVAVPAGSHKTRHFDNCAFRYDCYGNDRMRPVCQSVQLSLSVVSRTGWELLRGCW